VGMWVIFDEVMEDVTRVDSHWIWRVSCERLFCNSSYCNSS